MDPGIAQHLSVGYAGTAVLLGDGILHGGVAAGEGAVTSVGGVLVVLVIAGPVVLVAIVVVGVQDVLAGIHDVFASVLDILSDRVLAVVILVGVFVVAAAGGQGKHHQDRGQQERKLSFHGLTSLCAGVCFAIPRCYCLRGVWI